jgi:hypothetical protein
MPAHWIKEGTTSQVVRIVVGLSLLMDGLHHLEISFPSLDLLDHMVVDCRIKSHRRGVEYETSFASFKKTENRRLSTSVAHSKKGSSLLLEHTITSFLLLQALKKLKTVDYQLVLPILKKVLPYY